MRQDTTAATRRIMTELTEERRVPLVNLREGDVAVLLALPIAGLLLAGVFQLEWLVVPLVLAGVTTGVAIVIAAPDHLAAATWLQDVGRYYLLRPATTLAAPANATHPTTDGGLIEYTPFTPSERTQDLTSVHRAWPGTGAVERDDGAMEAFLVIEPTNMGFAMSGDWEQVQAAGQEFANNDLDFPLTLHTTTRSYPAAQLVAQLEDRLADPDVADNPAFAELIEEYRERRPQELADTREHRYYLGVTVRPLDVYSQVAHDRTPGEKLADLPVVGLFVQPFVERRAQRSAAQRRAAMIETLDDRLRTVRTQFVGDVHGWSATPLSTLETFLLATEFWTGQEYDRDDADRLLRTTHAIDRSPRGESA